MPKSNSPEIISVGTAVSSNQYTQQEILDIFDIKEDKIRSIFLNSGIKNRYLTLPLRPIETQGELLKKHIQVGLAMGAHAIDTCLQQAKATLSDVCHLCCVSSTGFITPGFSALLIKEMGLSNECSRLDIVGMGCHAGLNALNAVCAWTKANPGKLALLVCIEVCSAAYVFDGTMNTSVVNSLFGDGAGAISVLTNLNGQSSERDMPLPSPVCFTSFMLPEHADAMYYDWNDEHGKFSFFLDPEIPYILGANVKAAFSKLLEGTGVSSGDIQHWLVHSGGKKVIDSIRVNLELTRYDLRHTTGVLQDYGNVSSGSFLFSYERLLAEKKVLAGDYGVMMTMGPGTAIEMALLHWR